MRGGSSSSSASDSRRGLMRDDALGITFEHCGADEAEFLYEEIFTRRAYLQGGVQFPLTDTPSEPAVVVDAGANIGLFSLHCLALAPRATIIAVEPSPTAFAALERNLSGHASAACERLCLADVAAPARRLVEYAGATGESTSRPRERAAQRRRLADAAGGDAPAGGVASAFVCAQGTVSELIARHALRRVDLLKVDVEGDELLVLRGVGADDWPKVQQVAVEVHDVHGRLDACVALLRRHRFATTVVAQATSTEKGYTMVVPPALKLFYVYGVQRGRKRLRF